MIQQLKGGSAFAPHIFFKAHYPWLIFQIFIASAWLFLLVNLTGCATILDTFNSEQEVTIHAPAKKVGTISFDGKTLSPGPNIIRTARDGKAKYLEAPSSKFPSKKWYIPLNDKYNWLWSFWSNLIVFPLTGHITDLYLGTHLKHLSPDPISTEDYESLKNTFPSFEKANPSGRLAILPVFSSNHALSNSLKGHLEKHYKNRFSNLKILPPEKTRLPFNSYYVNWSHRLKEEDRKNFSKNLKSDYFVESELIDLPEKGKLALQSTIRKNSSLEVVDRQQWTFERREWENKKVNPLYFWKTPSWLPNNLSFNFVRKSNQTTLDVPVQVGSSTLTSPQVVDAENENIKGPLGDLINAFGALSLNSVSGSNIKRQRWMRYEWVPTAFISYGSFFVPESSFYENDSIKYKKFSFGAGYGPPN